MMWIILAFESNIISCWARVRIRNPDPGDKLNADPCGSRSETLLTMPFAGFCVKFCKVKLFEITRLFKNSQRTHRKHLILIIQNWEQYWWVSPFLVGVTEKINILLHIKLFFSLSWVLLTGFSISWTWVSAGAFGSLLSEQNKLFLGPQQWACSVNLIIWLNFVHWSAPLKKGLPGIST